MDAKEAFAAECGKGIHSEFNACMYRAECRAKADEIERLRALLLEARGWLNSRSALAKDIDCMLRVPNV